MGEVAASPKFREETPRKGRFASLQGFPEQARGHAITAAAEILFVRRPSALVRPPAEL
jgi:hypothetical protein